MPTITETLKTTDNKHFFKIADVCQMVVCETEADRSTHKTASASSENHENGLNEWPHGLAPPLKNCRRKRFRKTAPKKMDASPEVQREVRRLMKLDQKSESSWYQITDCYFSDDDDRDEGESEEGSGEDTDVAKLSDLDSFNQVAPVLSNTAHEDEQALITFDTKFLAPSESLTTVVTDTSDAQENDVLDIEIAPDAKQEPQLAELALSLEAAPKSISSSSSLPEPLGTGNASAQELENTVIVETNHILNTDTSQQKQLSAINELDRQILEQIRQVDTQKNPIVKKKLAAKLAKLEEEKRCLLEKSL